MKSNPAFTSQLTAPHWRYHCILVLLLAVLISACGGGGGSVNVNQAGIDSVTLSWTPPTQNEDGSPLTDLAAYRIYYGNEPDNYPTSIYLDNPGLVIYVVENLTPNTYYFVITAINSSGEESRYSGVAIRQVL
jgi:hypothetical protein